MGTGVFTELQKRLEHSTDYDVKAAALALAKSFLDGLKYHPYVFMLKHSPGEEPVYPYLHQLEILAYAMARKPVRMFIADEIGLGKTIEAIMIMKYLREVDRVSRVLILVPRTLVTQWIWELKRLGFGINEIYQIERETIDNIYAKGFPPGIYIASIDLAKMNRYRSKILSANWDVIIIDEAHRVGKVGNNETLRYSLATKLVKDCSRNVLLLSATPHRGKAEDYIERLKLLDPYLKASTRELDTEDFYRLVNGALVFRRTKMDVNNYYEKRPVFVECKFKARTVKASKIEIEFHNKLIDFLRTILLRYYDRIGEEPYALALLLVLIAKRASSSPKAALSTFNKILYKRAYYLKSFGENVKIDEKAIEKEVNEYAREIANSVLGSGGFEEISEVIGENSKIIDVDDIINDFAEKCSILLDEDDVKELKELYMEASKIVGDNDSRLMGVVNVVENHLAKGDRVVIFTEFKDTAEYIYNELKNRLRKWSSKIALVSSEKVIPPEIVGATSKRCTIDDVKMWLSRGYVDVLVMTDVASEGLNLQQANIVIHYEPPWSPIKIVQRVGRVWRLGQKKSVTSYTILLPVESDMKALEILYAKLLSWYVSGVEKSVPIGEELEIDMLGEGKGPIDLLITAPATDEKGRKIHFSEYKAWLEFLRDGAEGLKNYIERILAIMKNLKKYVEKMQEEEGLKEVKIDEKLRNSVLGGLCCKEAEEAIFKLFQSLFEISGYNVKVEKGKVYVDSHIYEKSDTASLYRAMLSLISEKLGNWSEHGKITLISRYCNNLDVEELSLYKVVLSFDDRPFYSDVAGVARYRSGKIDVLRGYKLIEMFSKLIANAFAVAHEEWSYGGDQVIPRLDSEYKDLAKTILKQFIDYVAKTENRFAEKHGVWMPRDISRDLRNPRIEQIGRIVVVCSEKSGGVAPPPIAIETVEKMAMDIAMKYEKMQGREPRDVSMYEHYDILSTDPRTGEVRYIEVKGRYESDIVVELTETEFEYAKRLGDSYWLYIVYNIGSKPQLIAIRNPVKNARWITVGYKRYVLLGLRGDAASQEI